MYQLINIVDQYTGIITDIAIYKIEVNSFIPKDPANTDYQKFKVDVADGVELQDPDGNVMTQEQVDQFLTEIP